MTIDEILAALRETQSAHYLNPGSSEAELAECEMGLGLEIPLPYKTFLRFSNGADLYETEEMLGTGHVGQAETLYSVTQRLRRSKLVPLPALWLPFYMGGGGRYFCFRTECLLSDGVVPVVEWLEERGTRGQAYASFEAWFEKSLYSEFHWRYVR